MRSKFNQIANNKKKSSFETNNSISGAIESKKLTLAFSAFQKGQRQEARHILKDLLTTNPKNFDALHLSAIISGQLNDLQKAIEYFQKALNINPHNAELHCNLANALLDDRKFNLAISHCNISIKLNALNPIAYSNRAISLEKLGKLEEALASYKTALNLRPTSYNYCVSIANILRELKKLEEALKFYDKAITLKPGSPDAYNNRGIIYHELNRFEQALDNFNEAITIKPDYAIVYSSLGNTLGALWRYEEAIHNYKKAISIDPEFVDAHANLSTGLLLLGNYEEGWLEYEWRSKSEVLNKIVGIRSFDQPLWLGKEPLKDKTILLYAEQGLGDTLQFCRYVPLVSALGAKVILEVHPSLVPLLYDLDGVSQIIAKDSKLPEFDYQCPLLSLPLAFKTTLETIPSSPSYITSNQNKVAIWQAQLGEKTKPRIGLVWSGSTTHKNDHNRSLTLARLLPYLSPSYEYISLQKEVRDIDQELLNKCEIIKQFGDQLQDFTDTAALCGLMDLVISVDSSVAHLAAAMGISTWVLLPYNPDWRWLLNRDDSPWYHSVKLYRQPLVDDWNSVLEKIQADKNFLLPSK